MNDWFRSWHGAPTDNKWLVIGRKAGVIPAVVSAVVWALLDHASQAEERGSIRGFDVETYAAFSGLHEDEIEAVIKALTDKGVIGPDGGFRNWEKRQPKREDGSAERAKAWRERKRNENEQGQTQSERDRTQANAPERAGTQIREDTDTDTEEDTPSLRSGESAQARAPHESQSAQVVVPLRLQEPKTRPPPGRGSRLPADFELTAEDIEHGRREGLTDEQIRRELDKFRDHWASASGANAVKRDWHAALRNWFRKAAEGFGGALRTASGGRGSPDGGLLGAYQRAAARFRHSDDFSQ